MESSDVFVVSEEDEEKLLKQRKCTPEKTRELVKELEEWFKTQPHLPQTFQYESFLEHALMHCFYNVKLAKKRLDLHFTYKAKNKDFYEMFGDDEIFIVPGKNPVKIAVLPKLYKNGERMVGIYIKNKDVEEYNFDHTLLLSLALVELAGKLDRSLVHMYVVDCEAFDINWMRKTDASKFLRFTTHLYKGYCSDLAAVHLVNAGSAIQLGLNLMKAVISEKYLMKASYRKKPKTKHAYGQIVMPAQAFKYSESQWHQAESSVKMKYPQSSQIWLKIWYAGVRQSSNALHFFKIS